MASNSLDALIDQTLPTVPINLELLPIVSPAQFASLVDRTLYAIQHWTKTPNLSGAARRRGKHLLIWRSRAFALAAGSKLPRHSHPCLSLQEHEITNAFSHPQIAATFPPLMSPETLGQLLGVGKSTIYRWKCFGYLTGTYTQRSDGIRFHRLKVLQTIFNGEEWD